MRGILKNEKGLTLVDILIGILIFILAVVFIISLVSNSIDKPKVAGIKGALDYYEKGTSLTMYQLPGLPNLGTLIAEINVEFDEESKFVDKKSKRVNAYGNPYQIEVEQDGDQTAVIIETVGKKKDDKYRVVVVKEEGVIEACTAGFGRHDKKLVTLVSEWCGDNKELGEDDGEGEDVVLEETDASCFEWEDNATGVTITDYICEDTDVVIPSEIDGKLVTIIGEDSFEQKGLKSAIIPSTVNIVEEYAFYVNELTSLIVPDSVTIIGEEAFSWNLIESVDIGGSVTELGALAFAGNQLTSIKLGASLKEIGRSAFEDNKLTHVDIPYGVKIIGDYSFSDNEIESVGIPDSVTKIGRGAFSINKLADIKLPTSLEEISAKVFLDNELTKVEIPKSVTKIGGSAFEDNQLTSVLIPDTVTEIGGQAFFNNQLTSVHIPNTSALVQDSAFDSGVTITRGQI